MKTLVTHNGTFHADDVFAVATFLLAHPEEKWQIIRTRDKDVISKADAVMDVGGEYDLSTKRFDHHQEGGAGARENGISYAAFGLVWKEYGALVCGGDFFVAKQMDDVLVAPIDANDNGIKLYEEIYNVSPFELVNYIKIQNPTWKEEEEWGERGDAKRLEIFLKLVDFASEIIQREIKRFKDKNSVFKLVENVYKNSADKRIIILDRFYPWKDALINYPEPMIVISPRNSDSVWNVEVVPKYKNSFEARILFPESWAGKRDEEMEKVTGVPGSIFCHNKRFLVVANTKDGAIELAKKALA